MSKSEAYYNQWECHKAIRTYGINVQYFVTQSFFIGAEFNTSWIINLEYKKEKESGYRNNYGSLRIKYNF